MNGKYVSTLEHLMLLVQYIEKLDLEYAMEVVNKSEALGPIIDPTAYIKDGAQNLMDAKRLIEAGLAFQAATEPLLAEARQRAVAHLGEG